MAGLFRKLHIFWACNRNATSTYSCHHHFKSCKYYSTTTIPDRMDFGVLTNEDLQFFQELLGKNGVKTEEIDE
jgi:hypothetical protein